MSIEQKEIQKKEALGMDVVATEAGKITYVTGGITQDCNYCDSCDSLRFEGDPDPDDWFHDMDEKAICEEMKAVIAGSLEPRDMCNISKPLWCPKLGRELTENEQQWAESSLGIAKAEY